MLAAKSNHGTDQGTSQALVCNSRLAVFTEQGVASSKAGWAWACPINASKSADEGMWGPMNIPSQ
jgi:hypothetical protein